MGTCRAERNAVPNRPLKHEVERSLIEVETDPGSGHARARLRFAADLEVFTGHFPHLKVVPGVYLIEASRLLAERVTGSTLEIVEVIDARFTAEVHPDCELTATTTVTTEEVGLRCDTRFYIDSEKTAQVRILLR